MTLDLNNVAVFIEVAETRNFRSAGERLGVTRSAVSQSIRRLEDRLGIPLFRRTTRSVRLTDAGETFLRQVAPAVADVQAAMAGAGDRDTQPSGRIRLAVSSIAERFISGGLFASFMDSHARVDLDVTITDEELDIVAHGFDAGVRLGEIIEQDMIAVPVSDDQRQMVVGSPGYFERHGVPEHPRDLARHRCIGWRPSPEVAPYRWEFEENGRALTVDVNPRLSTNDMGVMIRTALAGGGLTFGMEETFRAALGRGDLVAVMERYCPPFPGFYLYYPDRRTVAPKLRALVDHVRTQGLVGH